MTEDSRPRVHQSSTHRWAEKSPTSRQMGQANRDSDINPVTLLKDDKKLSALMHPLLRKPVGSETTQLRDSATASLRGSLVPASKSFTTPTSYDRSFTFSKSAYCKGSDVTGRFSRTSYGNNEHEQRGQLLKSSEYHRGTANISVNLESSGARPKEIESKDVSYLSGDTRMHMEGKIGQQGDTGISKRSSIFSKSAYCKGSDVTGHFSRTSYGNDEHEQRGQLLKSSEYHRGTANISVNLESSGARPKEIESKDVSYLSGDTRMHMEGKIGQQGDTGISKRSSIFSKSAYCKGSDVTGHFSRTSYGNDEHEQRGQLLKSSEYHRGTANIPDVLESSGARPKEIQSKDVGYLSGDTGMQKKGKIGQQGDTGISNHETRKEEDGFCIRLRVYNTRLIHDRNFKMCFNLEMYMKWKYILCSPRKLEKLNELLIKQCKCYCTAEPSVHFSSEILQSTEKLLTKLIQEFIDTAGSDLTVECFYVGEDEAIHVVKTLLDVYSVPLNMLYAKATGEKRVHIVYGKADKTDVIKLLDKTCPKVFVQVQMQYVWLALSQRLKLQEKLEKDFVGLACSFFKSRKKDDSDICICEFRGKMSVIENARDKLQFLKDGLKCKKYQIEESFLNAYSELNACAALQEKIDKIVNSACIIELNENVILLYACEEVEIDRVARMIFEHLKQKYTPMDKTWKSSEQPQELHRKLEENNTNDGLLVKESGSLCVAGLNEYRDEALNFTGNEQAAMNDLCSTKITVADKELFDTLKLLAEDIAGMNQIQVDANEAPEGCTYEFSGTYKAVTKTVENFKKMEKDIKKEHIFVDENFISSKDGEQFLRNLQSEDGVKIMHEKVAEDHNLLYGNLHKNKKTKLCKEGNQCRWYFPTGKSLMLDLMDIEQCVKADLIVVMTEEKQGKSDTKLSSKQTKMMLPIPEWTGGRKGEKQKFRGHLRRILSKARDDFFSSICFGLEPVSGWPFLAFIENLLIAILDYVQNFTEKSELAEVVLCSSSVDKVKKTEAFIRKNIDPSYVENEIQIEVVRGELNLFEADVLVNTTTPTLDLDFGQVSAALLQTAGAEIQIECKKRYPRGVQGPKIAVTLGYSLKCQYVFHGALHAYSTKSQTDCLQELRDFLNSCFEEANRLQISSIAFPVIGSGNLGFPVGEVASEMFTSVERFKQNHKEFSIRFVYFVVYHKDKESIKIFEKLQEAFDKSSETKREPLVLNEDNKSSMVKVTIIGKSNNAKQAKKELEQRVNIQGKTADEFKHGDQEITQYVDNITTYLYSALLKAFPVELEEINDEGVNCKWENNRIKVEGKSRLVVKAVKTIKDLVKDLVGMFTKQVSVTDKDHEHVKLILRKLSRDYPDIVIVHDRINSLIHLYGKVQKDIREAEQILGCDKVTTTKNGKKEQKIDKDILANNSVLYKTQDRQLKAKNLKTYKAREITVKVCQGDLLEAPTACIVNAANEDLQHAGGVAFAIAAKAGDELKKESYQISQSVGPLRVGSVVETTAGKLKDRFDYILHTVGPNWYDYMPITQLNFARVEQDLHSAILNTFRKAEDLKLKSLALPAISSAIFRVPHEVCALQYAKAVCDFAKEGRSILKEIYFIDQDDRIVAKIQEVFNLVITKNKTYLYDPKMYSHTQLSKGSELTGRDVTLNQQQAYETAGKDNLSSKGLVSLQPHYRLDKGKMICMFTTCHEIQIYTGNILELNGIDAIVCSEDKSWAAAGMVAKKLLDIGGKEYRKAKQKAYRENPSLDDGDVLITIGGQNKYPWVIHALVPNGKPPEALKDLTEDILEKCVIEGFKSTVMSLVGSGSGRVDPAICSKQLLTAYEHFCLRNPRYKFTLHLVNIDEEKTKILQSVFSKYIEKKSVSHRIMEEVTDIEGNRDNLTVTLEGGSRIVQVQPESLKGYSKLDNKIHAKKTKSVAGMNENERESYTDVMQEKVKHISDSMKSNHQTALGVTEEEYKSKEKKNVAPGADGDDKTDMSANCVICMDKLDNPRKLRCGHVFCAECIEQYFKVKPVCPTCFTVCGVITGDQPDGVMEIQKLKTSVSGYENCGTVCITYKFGRGKQGPEHPKPGAWYSGIQRAAYLPNNVEGRKICAMLKLAFERRLVFTIGTSRTTGHEGVITWNDIHHKTDPHPNTQYGYPDETYLSRIKEELVAKGIFEEDIDINLVKKLKNESNFCEIVKSSASSTATKL